MRDSGRVCMIKRAFDILSPLFGLILLAPVLIGVGHLIRREDRGPCSEVGGRMSEVRGKRK